MLLNLLRQVEDALRKRERHDPEYKAFREKTTKLRVLGLRLPVIHEVEERGFQFYAMDALEVLVTWDRIWRTSTVHEALSLPLFYYRHRTEILERTHWRVMKGWIDRVENWEHADALCALYSIFLERFPTVVLPTLKQWNRSRNPWKRRASVVSTIYYASPRRTPPSRKVVLSLIEPLLQDRDAYVQKGVGWQLREAYTLWPREILIFLESHVLELPAITFSYATEKLTKTDKTRLKERRANKRRH